ncbi:DUF4159 domain-containing protein [Arcticibacterium luteifluviistationis]|uniref:DUF4159 domain-containing protein n=1 Tax=Arcticibacterium luteifluviistationis TaxID=1784714 RepID=A0A2Z4G7H2_9BACT|nr:DUF4159 domain-containing protein [Arcticibacterium luteifluviistationis]AWV97008.1 hypothetical protein DJ013_01970 [Arcticibacterium luteifluviistationis]
MRKLFIMFCLLGFAEVSAQSPTIKIARLKYGGGGDWYSNKTSLPNLISYCNTNLKMNIFSEEDIVDASNSEIFQYPFVHMTGHGNVIFSDAEADNLRKYLISGGFLHVDDNYGLSKFIRREMLKVFPESEFVEVPFSHPIYHQKYKFASGLPKVHEHDNKAPQGFGLFYEGRLVCFFTYESDLGNGWEDQSVYGDPESIRTSALQMGANIVSFAFTAY